MTPLLETHAVALARPIALLVGTAAATSLRVAIGGRPAGASITAALVFSTALVALAAAAGRPTLGRISRAVFVGFGGAAVLCLLPTWRLLEDGPSGAAVLRGFPLWALVVALVAVAEEAVLRGVLHDAIVPHVGEVGAVTVGALAFALLHLPLYGAGSVPLDLAAGVWLGALRVVSGSVVAPALAHVLADWGAWWLR